jgi:hypothetical protein
MHIDGYGLLPGKILNRFRDLGPTGLEWRAMQILVSREREREKRRSTNPLASSFSMQQV